MRKSKRIARDLHAYLSWRARQEGIEYALPQAFYVNAIEAGITGFFGIVVGSSGMISDERQPELFASWMTRRRPKAKGDLASIQVAGHA
jgi:hypothetical protein